MQMRIFRTHGTTRKDRTRAAAQRAAEDVVMTPKWTSERPTKPGEYWLSLHPSMRASLAKELRMTPPSVLKVQLDRGSILTEFWWGDNAIEDEFLDGALWAPRETPADPFAKTDPMRTDQDGREYNHDDREALPGRHAIRDRPRGRRL